ncbi:MAG: amidohydrolase [Anaerolineae bacterium]
MKRKSTRMTRRQFLTGAGVALTGAALACGRARDLATLVAPTLTPTALPPTPDMTPLPKELAADLLMLNGKIITVDPQDTIAEAVAVKDGCIQAVGTRADIATLAGESTRIIDLGGRAVTPGLIDAHNHLQVAGLLSSAYVAFLPPEVRTLDDLRDGLAEALASRPEGEWLQGYFLVLSEGGLPTRHDLDPVSLNHPVWILQQGGHYGSANSLALQIAGITAATPDPVGGVIERDASGEPTGVFYNHRAMDLLRLHIPRQTTDDVRQNILSSEPLFAAYGVTSYHDNNVRGVDTVHTYLDAGKRDELLLRGAVYYTLEWPGDLERALHEIERYGDDFVRFAGFKFLLDGQALMAYCHQPHNGVRWDFTTWDPQSFKDTVRALHDTGLQICTHVIGDAAVDLTLDAYEEAMNANPRSDPRHRLEHVILTRPETTQRIKDLGVVVSTQPQFIRVGAEHWKEVFGEARMERIMVTREWLEAGIPLALGSDAPTTPWLTPQVTLAGAVGRFSPSDATFEPDQCLTIQEALRAHTMGAAYAVHEEDIKGSIEVGKLADLVVWSEDPYTVSLQQLWQIPMDLTLIGGEVIYDRTS